MDLGGTDVTEAGTVFARASARRWTKTSRSRSVVKRRISIANLPFQMCSEGVMSGTRRGLYKTRLFWGTTDRDRPGHENWMEVANRSRERPQAHSVTIAGVNCDRALANLKSAVAAVDLAHP